MSIIEGSDDSEGLEIGTDATRVGMVTFSNNAKKHWGLTDYTVRENNIVI